MARAIGVAALLCAAPACVHAQGSVTLYGILDAGIQYRTHADGTNSEINLQNYGNIPSLVGMSGKEELGGGLSAVFKLEQGLNLNDGTPTVPGYAFFRGAYVGLSGPFGTATIGRQTTVLFDQNLYFDPLLLSAYSADGEVIPVTDNFVSNAVKFKSASLGGIELEALAATGGIAGRSTSGRVLELGVQFSGTSLGASGVIRESYGTYVSDADDTSGLKRVIATLAANYHIGGFTAYAGFERQTGDLAPVKTVLWTGARYQIFSDLSFAGGVYQTLSNTPSVGNPTLYSFSMTYNLSKRTSTYLNAAYSRNSSQSSQTVYEYDPTLLNGVGQLGVMLGITHTF
ncbi:porin [Paraburkholderia caffeinilytica]|uniref:porin n=1 Tax=Paraburkholderia caffeinilytica TaxID=1761016 RepID=UPI0038BCCEB6